MFSWVQQQIANVAGTQEPIYGPEAIKSVAEEAKEVSHTETTRTDLTWKTLPVTNVETKTFYLMADSGNFAMLQIIYSNVGGLRVTSQFSTKVIYADRSKPLLWSTTPLNNLEFNDDKTAIYADDCAVELSEDGQSYSIKSLTDEHVIVNIKLTQKAPGFHAGKTGYSHYGTDHANPWGSMRHALWPRCTVEGTITTDDGTLDFAGIGLYIYALQGMKPHHAAARWNFVDFQGPNYTASIIEFTTPESYGTTTVGVGSLVKDGEIVFVTTEPDVKHTETVVDPDTQWPEPKHMACVLRGKTKAGEEIEAKFSVDCSTRIDRVDVMAEVPAFVKSFVALAAGTSPYVYKYLPGPAKLNLTTNGVESTEDGNLYAEASFIS